MLAPANGGRYADRMDPAAAHGRPPPETRAAGDAELSWTSHPAEGVIDRMIDEFDRPGRSSGRGFYDYSS